MSLTKDERDRAVVAKLSLGFSAIEVKEMCDTTLGLEDFKLSRIYTLSRELNNSKDDTIATDFAALPVEVVQHVVDEGKATILGTQSDINKQQALASLDNIVKSKKGLELLNDDFQEAASEALRVFKSHLADPELPLKDAVLLLNTIASAHKEIFSSTTNIHIGDNNKSEQKLSVFQNTMRS